VQDSTRRALLGACTTGVLAGVAGCGAQSDEADPVESTTREDRPTEFEDPDARPSRYCHDREPLEPSWSVGGPGPRKGFELRIDDPDGSIGGRLEVRLRNVTDETRTTGVKKKFDIQQKHDDGWRSIFGVESYQGIIDKAVTHEPGEGFDWQLIFSKEGLSDAFLRSPTYYVCSPIDAGEYRFVYHGISADRALGHPFTMQ